MDCGLSSYGAKTSIYRCSDARMCRMGFIPQHLHQMAVISAHHTAGLMFPLSCQDIVGLGSEHCGCASAKCDVSRYLS